ncbi:hypothetical protein ES703_68534 [subsurface metagenome]
MTLAAAYLSAMIGGDYCFPQIEDSQIIFYNPMRKATRKTAAGRTKQAESYYWQTVTDSACDLVLK